MPYLIKIYETFQTVSPGIDIRKQVLQLCQISKQAMVVEENYTLQTNRQTDSQRIFLPYKYRTKP